MKKSMSSLNVKKKISVKALLSGCAILCPALISTPSASAMLKTYTDSSLSNLEVIKKLENEKNKEQEEQEREKEEYEEERARIEADFKKENPLTNVIPRYILPPNIEDYNTGNYPKEKFIEQAQNIYQETNKKIADLLSQDLPQDGEEFQVKKRELELGCQIKSNLLEKNVEQCNQQNRFHGCFLI